MVAALEPIACCVPCGPGRECDVLEGGASCIFLFPFMCVNVLK